MRGRLPGIELALLLSCVGCQQPHSDRARPLSSASAPRDLAPLLRPRAAGPLRQADGKLRQEQPRLPDTGEWRCAERGGVVWCAGGEAAAGVVAGPPDAAFRCGTRWGQGTHERVCIDLHPDYADTHTCAFEQEQGISRVCRAADGSRAGPALPARALPACWLDRDCPSEHCERGACACRGSGDCSSGSCQAGFCVEVGP